MLKKYGSHIKIALTGLLLITLVSAIVMVLRFCSLPDQITTEIKISDLKSPDFNDSKSSQNAIKVTFEPKRDMIGLLRFVNLPTPGFDPAKVTKTHRIISAHYDKRTGLVICNILVMEQDQTEKTNLVYMGPHGIAAKPDSALGKFKKAPLMNESALSSFSTTVLIFDPESRQLYTFDPFALTYTESLPIRNDIQPVKISTLFVIGNRNWSITIGYPAQALSHPAQEIDTLILDKTGAIYVLNTATMTLSNSVAFIPHVDKNPLQMLAFAAVHRSLNFKDVYITASVPDNGDALHVRIYDDKGKILYDNINYTPGLDGRLITSITAQSFLPFISCVSSYCLGPYFTAMDSYQSFFLVPHVLLAGTSRMTDSRLIMPVFFLFWPLLVGVILACLTLRNAKQLGIPNKSCCPWFLGVLFFGVPAFLTWLCVRPKITMITCNSCGLPRRPDTEKCHHCGAKLTLPAPQNAFSVKNPAGTAIPK